MDISALAQDLTSGDQVKAYKAERQLNQQTAAVGASDKESERKELAAAIAKAIADLAPKYDGRDNPTAQSQETVEGRNTLIRYIALVAGDPEIPILKETLKNHDSRDMVRWALERINSEQATKVLAEAAVNEVGDRFRIGVLHSLAHRAGAEVTKALKKCVTDPSPQVRLAAAEALAAHADPEADAAIVRAGKGAGRRGQLRIARARLRLAENLSLAGHKAAAVKICDEVKGLKNMPAQTKSAEILQQRLA